jgi:hypothetical protein
LGDVLREVADACTEYEYGTLEILNTGVLGDTSARKVQRLRDEGLLSPGNTHLEQLHDLLRDIEGRWRATTQLPGTATGGERLRLLEANRGHLDSAVGRVHARARTYVRATTKMDNGSYLACLRWKRLGLRKSQGANASGPPVFVALRGTQGQAG